MCNAGASPIVSPFRPPATLDCRAGRKADCRCLVSFVLEGQAVWNSGVLPDGGVRVLYTYIFCAVYLYSPLLSVFRIPYDWTAGWPDNGL